MGLKVESTSVRYYRFRIRTFVPINRLGRRVDEVYVEWTL